MEMIMVTVENKECKHSILPVSGGCKISDELVLIMSTSRHPQTLQLYKSAQVIEDEACIDILHFTALDTYSNRISDMECILTGPPNLSLLFA